MRASKVFSFFLVLTLFLTGVSSEVIIGETYNSNTGVKIKVPIPISIINGTGGNVSIHNNLTGLQGGSSDEYYHLNISVYTEIISDVFDWVTSTEGDGLWCALTGCTITGNLDVDNNISAQYYCNSTSCYTLQDFLTAGSGSVSGTGLANRGAFWTDSNTLSYDGNFTWDNTNKRLGIGTDTPLALLHLNGGTGTLATGLAFGFAGDTGFFEASDNKLNIMIQGQNAFQFASRTLFVANGVSGAGMLGEASSAVNPTLVPRRNDLNSGMGSAGADKLSLIAGGVEWLRLDNVNSLAYFPTGNIGIGTTTPQRELHVNGDILSNSTINATGDICIEGGNCLSDLKGNLTNFSILQGINNASIDNLDFNILNFNALNSYFNGNITVNSINITSPSSMFLAGVQWSEETITLAGFNFSTILVSKLKYFTIGDNLAGQELGFQTQNFNPHPNSSSYIATVNSNGFGNGIFKFSSFYNPYPDWSVYFNNKGLTNFYGYYNDSETMNTSNSGVYFGLASNFLTGINESVVGYQDELFNAYYTKDNFTFFTNTNIEKNLTVQGNIIGSRFYGEMYSANNSVETNIAVINTWANVTSLECGLQNNVVCEGDNLTINYPGVYEAKYNVGFENANNNNFKFSISVNGNNQNKCQMIRKLGSNDQGSAGTSCLLNLNEGDNIKLIVQNMVGTSNPIIVDSNINLINIGN